MKHIKIEFDADGVSSTIYGSERDMTAALRTAMMKATAMHQHFLMSEEVERNLVNKALEYLKENTNK